MCNDPVTLGGGNNNRENFFRVCYLGFVKSCGDPEIINSPFNLRRVVAFFHG